MSVKAQATKKIKSFIKKVINLHEVQTLLSLIDPKPDHMMFLISDDHVDEYVDNPLLLKEHGSLCFKDFSRLRGKKEDSATALSQFLELYASEFPESTDEQLIDNKAGGRGRSKRKSIDGESISSEHLSALKLIIKQLMKHEFADPFLYPVDSTVFPEYYEIIDSPMDLTTALEKLPECKSVEQALNNLNQIWANCKKFNQDGAPIIESAETLSAYLDELVASKLGSDFVVRSGGSNTIKTASHTKVDKRRKIVLSKPTMKKIIQDLKPLPFAAPFIDPVNLDDAPGYMNFVQTMMDLSTIETNIKNGVYSNSKQLRGDVQLIVSNCEAYNHESSDIVKMAHQLKEKFDEFVTAAENVATEEVNEPPILVIKKSRISTTRPKGGTPLPQSTMLKIVQDLKNLPCAIYFILPVNLDEAPGYKELISYPMDLTTIEKNVKSGEYNESEGFKFDVKHIWMNCQVYNHESSDIYHMATTFKEKFEELIKAAEDSHKQPKGLEDTETRKVGRPRLDDSSRVKPDESLNEVLDENPTKLDIYSFENMKNWKPNKIDQLQDQLSKSAALTGEACRYRCAQRAREIKHNARSGFYDKNGVYHVLKLGKIPSISTDHGPEVIQSYHTSGHIFPHGYKCNVFLRVCLVPENNEPLELDITENTTPYVDIEFSSNILGAVASSKDRPQFAISFDNGVLVVEGNSGREVWGTLTSVGTPLNFFKVLGGKIHRCRSVFNRICCHPEISPFLEQVPFSGSIGSEYYESIKAPMWLREVHTRLKEGVYDCEFDFAWDMRLIFSNCMEFNKPNSELHKTAQKILHDFEHLLCFWVHSIQDSNIVDHAKGEFDDWQYLRYFDASDPNRHFCKETNVTLPETDLIMCVICEDEYSLPVAGIEKKTADIKKNYKCKRCCVMEEVLPFGFDDIPTMSETSRNYCKEELATGFQWVPSQDEKLAAGWAQAKAIKQHRITNRFLSPLGSEFAKRDEALKAIADERKAHESLLADRAKEFQESMSGKAKKGGSSPRRARRSRNNDVDVENESSNVNTPAAAMNEEGRIIYGKLYDYVVPEGYTLSWYIRSLAWPDPKAQDPNAATRLVKVQDSMLGQSGFFGLHNDDVRRAVESLDKSEMCSKYQFKDAEIVIQELIKEIALIKDLKNQQQDVDSRMNSILASQKWYWEIVEKNLRKKWGEFRNQAIPNANAETAAQIYMERGFKPLFLNNTKEGEMLLAVWDFLDCSSTILGENPFTFTDIMECIEKPGAVCTYGQVLFDDVCCHLTSFLLHEFKQALFLRKDAAWFKFTLYKPLNMITWPLVAQTALFYLTKPTINGEFVADTACLSNDSDSLIRKEIITLVLAHPSCPYVGNVNKLGDIRSRIASSSLDNTAQLVNELVLFFDDAKKQHYPESKEYCLANDMFKWFCKLLERLNVEGPKFGDDEMDTNSAIPNINPEYASDNYLNPFDFGNTIATEEGAAGIFNVRLQALNALESTLTRLRTSDPESWDKDEKLAILATLVDYGSQAEIFQEKKNVVALPNNYTDVADIPDLPEQPFEFEYCNTFGNSDVCYFTGISTRIAPAGVNWVYVPQLFLENNDMNAVMHPNGPPVISGRPICLENICNRLLAAREITAGKRRKYDEFLSRILDDLERDALSLSLGKSTLGRGVPIGQDSKGAQYWLLECQAHSNFCVGDSPCVLVRNCTGWWGYYSGKLLTPLLNNLDVAIPIERVLRETIIIRLYRARFDFAALKNPSEGGYGSIYEQWVQRYKKLLERARTLLIPVDVDTMEAARGVSMVEHFWHIFAEVRATMYHAILQRKMDDDCKPLNSMESAKSIEKRRKKIRDSWPEDSFDCHPLKGFFRTDGFQSIRHVSCTLTATKIMADPYILILYINMNQKSRVRELLDDNNERVQVRLKEILAEKAEADALKKEEDAEDVEEDGEKSITPDVNLMDVDRSPSVPIIQSERHSPRQVIPIFQQQQQQLYVPPVYPTHSGHTLIQKMKAVEQLHITSGEVLRIYPRGKDAATEMGISHSGISLCCGGKQDDFCGFKWKFYTGPPVPFESIEHLQTPMEDLLKMKMSRNKAREVIASNMTSENVQEVQPKEIGFNRIYSDKPYGNPSVVALYGYRPAYPTYAQDKERENKEEIISSTVFVSGRLLKIKSEMINLLYILPERKLKFADDEEDEKEEKDNELDNQDQQGEDEEDEMRLKKLKIERKKQRRERRAQGLNRLTARIQGAANVKELYKVLIYLEESYLNATENYDFDDSMFPSETNLSSILSTRLFTFDRCLRYDSMDLIDKVSRPDIAHHSKKFRNKLQYVPKCYISPNCNLSMAHYGMFGCNSTCSASRICENAKESRVSAIPDWRSSATLSNIQLKSKSNIRYRPNDDDEDEENEEEEEEEEEEFFRKNKKRRFEDDIETVSPLVPPRYLWKTTTWL